jgi:outer membrane lipoprotein-sorting protein
MTRYKSLLFASPLLACMVLSGCGTSSPKRAIESMTVTPATADAQSFANGMVQFTATGTFSQPPSPAQVPTAPPYGLNWTTSDTNTATIDPSGVAQCVSGGSGIVTITARAFPNSCIGTGCASAIATATANLTCP